MGVDHGGFDILVPKQLLDSADIVAILEEVGSEGIPKGRLRAAGRCGGRQVYLSWRGGRLA